MKRFLSTVIILSVLVNIINCSFPEDRFETECREIQKLYNEQNFETLFYRFHKDPRRNGIGGSHLTEEDFKRHFIKLRKAEFEKLGKIKEAQFEKKTYRYQTPPQALFLRYNIKFEKADCTFVYEFIIENNVWGFYRFYRAKCSV